MDIPLNDAGRREAKQLGELLKKIPFSHLYSSPLKRALETAQLIQHALPTTTTLCLIDDLRERGWGELEGMSNLEMYRIENF